MSLSYFPHIKITSEMRRIAQEQIQQFNHQDTAMTFPAPTYKAKSRAEAERLSSWLRANGINHNAVSGPTFINGFRLGCDSTPADAYRYAPRLLEVARRFAHRDDEAATLVRLIDNY